MMPRLVSACFIVLIVAGAVLVMAWGAARDPQTQPQPEARLLVPVFADSFDVPDGSAPDPERWQLSGRMFSVVAQDGQLRLAVAATDDAPSDAEPAAVLPLALRDARMEADVTLPSDTGEWFLTFGLRAPPTLDDAYLLVFHHRENGVLQWRLQKYVDAENTPLTPNVPLDAGLAYRIRLEVLEDHIRAAVRPLTAGSIPDGAWDLQARDRDLIAPGTARPHLTKRAGRGSAQAYVDDFRVYEAVR